jgi:hypothetical protein
MRKIDIKEDEPVRAWRSGERFSTGLPDYEI